MTKHVTGALAAIWLLSAPGTFAQQTTKAPASPPSPTARPAPVPGGGNVNSDAKLMADFKTKVERYVNLRKGLEKDVPPLKKTDDPGEIIRVEQAMAAKVRAARPQAKRDDFFTPATQALFRRLVSPVVNGRGGTDVKSAIQDDAPEPDKIPFRINAEYPKKEPLSTVPPNILQALPALPDDIQYRFAGRHLLLYDTRPNIILDFILNALPPN